MVSDLFQGKGVGMGTQARCYSVSASYGGLVSPRSGSLTAFRVSQEIVMSSWDYVSTGLKKFDNLDADGFYISPAFMDKLTLHLAKNFMELPKIKVPLILGIWGGKGQGKTFQCDLVYKKLGCAPIVMSAGELESGNAGEPAKLVRQRYREAGDIIKKGKMASLFINDLVRLPKDDLRCGDFSESDIIQFETLAPLRWDGFRGGKRHRPLVSFDGSERDRDRALRSLALP